MVGGAAVVAGAVAARLRRRARSLPPPEPTVDPRAEDLRRKLAESRELVGEQAEFEAAETPIDTVEPVEDVDAERRDLHAQARATIDEMRKT
jgi:hypothetical protein